MLDIISTRHCACCADPCFYNLMWCVHKITWQLPFLNTHKVLRHGCQQKSLFQLNLKTTVQCSRHVYKNKSIVLTEQDLGCYLHYWCLIMNQNNNQHNAAPTETRKWLVLNKGKKTKNAYKKRKMKISKNKKNVFFSHVPRITQPKN